MKPLTGQTPRQRDALLWCALLPVMMGQTAALSGRGGIWGAAAAAPLALLLGLLWRRLARNRAPARWLRLLTGLWLIPAGGVLLRAGADRLVAAVYPESPEWLFLLGLLLSALPAGLGRRRTLGRLAELTAPVLALLLGLVLALSLPEMDGAELWPPRREDWADALIAALRTLGAAALALTLFPPEPGEGPASPLSLAGAAAAGLVLAVTVTGTFGAAAAREMDAPFFVLIRNLRPGQLPERMEALAAGTWVASDYLLLSALLQTAGRALGPEKAGAGRERKPWAVLLAAAGMGVLAAWVPTSFALESIVRDLGSIINVGVRSSRIPTFS